MAAAGAAAAAVVVVAAVVCTIVYAMFHDSFAVFSFFSYQNYGDVMGNGATEGGDDILWFLLDSFLRSYGAVCF